MFVVLPVIAILLFITGKNIRESLLLSLVINGLFVAISTDFLSLVGALSFTGVAASWILFILGGFFARSRLHRWFAVDAHADSEPVSLEVKAMVAVLAMLFSLLGFTAIMAAPNNWDSLTYHLPRILHWIQNGSVAHYPTHITRQLIMPPWSEYAMMHLFLLSGGDRFVNCVQWLSMVGSCVGVSLIVKKMGGTPGNQYAAAVIAATLPLGLLEATSTQNDYALAFWCVAFSLYTLAAIENLAWPVALLCSASLGLALLTKGTGYIILFPVILGAIIMIVKRGGTKSLALKLLAGILIVLLLNAGFYLRNWSVFGSPLTTDEDRIINTSPDLRIALLSVVRSLGVHLASNSGAANDALYAASSAVHGVLGVDRNDPRFVSGYSYRIFQYRNHEDYASNPLHTILFLAGVIAAIVFRKKLDKRQIWYVTVISASFLALSIMIRWNVWLSRYFVPVFVLTAPLVVISLRQIIPRYVAAAVLLLLLCSGGYLAVTNETRPLVGAMSILHRDRMDQYFANAPDLRTYYMGKLTTVVMTGQSNVALSKLNGDVWEYPVWVMLPAMANRPIRIEHVNVQNRSKIIPLKAGFDNFAELVL